MIKVALRGLAGRKLRAVLTGIAIVLGVAMISGTYILTDTVQRAFNELLVDSYAGTDAVVTGKGLPEGAVERAVQLSHEKYCSASIMLAKTAEITTSVEIVEA